MMRLDNPARAPQHQRPGLLFWSASLAGNNEWASAVASHWKSSAPLTENRTCRECVDVCVCVLNGSWVCVCEASRH